MSLIRTVMERIGRGRAIARRLPANVGGGRIYVSPDAALSLLKPRLESDLFEFAREFVQPAHHVWDIGANVGLFSFSAAHFAGRAGAVLALEPDLFLCGLLRRTAACQADGSAPVEILPAAVSDRLTISSFDVAARGRASNALQDFGGRSQSGGVRETTQVITLTLDWLLEQRPRPQVVKIDVEGAEGAVLRGAARLLKEVRPIILCEVGDHANDEVTQLFRDNRYEMSDWDQRSKTPLKRATWNTLARPL